MQRCSDTWVLGKQRNAHVKENLPLWKRKGTLGKDEKTCFTQAVFTLVFVDVKDGTILTSTSNFNMTPNCMVDVNIRSRPFFDVVKKSCR